MKIFLISTVVLSLPLAFAETFTTADKKKSVEAYGKWSFMCKLGDEHISYTISDNQIDPQYANTCVLTYSYSKCLSGPITEAGCPDKKWKRIVSEKVLLISQTDGASCFNRAKKLVDRLKGKEFRCSESGIN